MSDPKHVQQYEMYVGPHSEIVCALLARVTKIEEKLKTLGFVQHRRDDENRDLGRKLHERVSRIEDSLSEEPRRDEDGLLLDTDVPMIHLGALFEQVGDLEQRVSKHLALPDGVERLDEICSRSNEHERKIGQHERALKRADELVSKIEKRLAVLEGRQAVFKDFDPEIHVRPPGVPEGFIRGHVPEEPGWFWVATSRWWGKPLCVGVMEWRRDLGMFMDPQGGSSRSEGLWVHPQRILPPGEGSE